MDKALSKIGKTDLLLLPKLIDQGVSVANVAEVRGLLARPDGNFSTERVIARILIRKF